MMDRTQMAGLLKKLVLTLYDGGPVPPAEGGLLFRSVCEAQRNRGDLFWTERRLHDLARELGYWPWNVNQIVAAVRKPQMGDHTLPDWVQSLAPVPGQVAEISEGG